MSADLKVTDVVIDARALDPDDVEILQDMVAAAVNEALREAQDLQNSKMSRVMGGMNLPGLGL